MNNTETIQITLAINKLCKAVLEISETDTPRIVFVDSDGEYIEAWDYETEEEFANDIRLASTSLCTSNEDKIIKFFKEIIPHANIIKNVTLQQIFIVEDKYNRDYFNRLGDHLLYRTK